MFLAKLNTPQDVRDRAFGFSSELYITAKALYDRVLNMTTTEFSRGAEKPEREALAEILTHIDKVSR